MKPRVLVGLLAAAVIAIGSLQLTRSGYSVDEEFTVYAVRGIASHGLPVFLRAALRPRHRLPYAAWLAVPSPARLPAFRAVSLISAAP